MIEEITRLLKAHHDELDQWLSSPALGSHITLLQEVAAGAHGDTGAEASDTLSDNVEIALGYVLAALHRDAWGSEDIDPAFWQSDLGRTLALVQMWLLDGDLCTIKEASQELRGSTDARSLMYIHSLIKGGHLDAFIDPREPNPRRARRVLRSQVWALQIGLQPARKPRRLSGSG